jgi:hypothetical protein
MNDEKLKNGLSPEALAQEEKRRVESGNCKNLECPNAGRSRVLIYELLSRGRTRRMTTNAETYSTGNGYPTKCDTCHISDPLAFLLVLDRVSLNRPGARRGKVCLIIAIGVSGTVVWPAEE